MMSIRDGNPRGAAMTIEELRQFLIDRLERERIFAEGTTEIEPNSYGAGYDNACRDILKAIIGFIDGKPFVL